MNELSLIQKIIVCTPPIILAVTLHEVAHGWAAKLNGDDTAEKLGRLSLNPIKHIDPIGTIALPAFLAATTGFIFGWAKPVPIAYNRLNHPKKDIAKVAVAGPAANLVMMIFWVLLIKIVQLLPQSAIWFSIPLLYMSAVGIYINCILMILNLLPFPPLDGSRILASYLPNKLAYKFSQIEPYGLLILLGLVISGILGKILLPVVNFVINQFSIIANFDILQLVFMLFS